MKAWIKHYPIAAFFVLAFAISWTGCILLVGPKYLSGAPMGFSDTLVLFLMMLAGPSIAGVTMTAVVDGKAGLRDLFARMRKWRVGGRWYAAALLIPSGLFLAVLLALTVLVSPAFRPSFTVMGILVGLLAGLFEETGWMGYAYPKMAIKYTALTAALYLGLLHALWHIVPDFLGASRSHGIYWLPTFLIWMVAVLPAQRVLIAWVYQNTGSLLLAMLMHASSTGFQYVFAPPAGLSTMENMLVYAAYAALNWIVVAIVVARYGKSLVKADMSSSETGGERGKITPSTYPATNPRNR
jgi:membrane protease YdiL (CAAX protease family)